MIRRKSAKADHCTHHQSWTRSALGQIQKPNFACGRRDARGGHCSRPSRVAQDTCLEQDLYAHTSLAHHHGPGVDLSIVLNSGISLGSHPVILHPASDAFYEKKDLVNEQCCRFWHMYVTCSNFRLVNPLRREREREIWVLEKSNQFYATRNQKTTCNLYSSWTMIKACPGVSFSTIWSLKLSDWNNYR